MGTPLAVALLIVGLSAVIGGFSIWTARSRRRSADEALDRARTESERLLKQAERDVEALRKEAAIEAREKAHEIAAAEEKARERREAIAGLEQALADKTRAFTDRLAATDRTEQDLRARATALVVQEKSTAASLARCEQLTAERQRELQRIAAERGWPVLEFTELAFSAGRRSRFWPARRRAA